LAIEVLSQDVVNQIAAGEVLERPANLIKELVENSIDAGADEIEVEFDSGGRTVSVSDNGHGMDATDLALCLKPHATSKIKASSDLFRLASYGFRGEALASIAGVSEIGVTSRAKGAPGGHRIQAKFGLPSEVAPVAAVVGTQIHVRELFANVPARLEFMKSEPAEHTQIKNTLKALALSCEKSGFKARSRGEMIWHWPKSASFLERAREVLQNKNLMLGTSDRGGARVEAAVGSPRETQAVNRNLWFFVQGRWVQDRTLTAAVMEAYRNLLMHGEYPMAVVRIWLEPSLVDVNVHPTKSAVKFRDSQTVFRAVSEAVRSVLEKASWLSESALDTPQTAALGVVSAAEVTASFQAPEFAQIQYSTKAFPLAEVREAIASYTPAQQETVSPKSVGFKWSDLHLVGQAHLTYIVAQSEEALYLVDQHAAHERVVFERLMASFENGNMDIQTLLLPLSLDLPEPEVDALLGAAESLSALGLSLERMGPSTLVVQTLPSLIQEGAVLKALERTARELVSTGGSLEVKRLVGDIFATMACHSVVRAGQAQSLEQMKQLLQQMDEFPLSSFCPHGRPVYTRRGFTEIEREFGRIN
jgi:DNA mismatch repair protein MutL